MNDRSFLTEGGKTEAAATDVSHLSEGVAVS
jgi:hypothetical protein